jgi:hypothetical protein
MSPPAVQGIAVPNSQEKGYSSVYRSVYAADGLKKYETEEVTTLYESFERAVRLGPKQQCLGRRTYDRATKVWGPYIWQTYEEVQAIRNNVGGGLLTIFEQLAHVSFSIMALMYRSTDQTPMSRDVSPSTRRIAPNGRLPILPVTRIP